ncbi:hypothetical protein INT45_006875 [Circinella minor]|uniref:A-kinase anchor protein 7-like phosphoesterase domain-containing protein n=1 Tax=Circinella minor TaxID=1195481 RepID=A0A8H7S026_9FUNG|nr:hypothetical protein INT45_006875 [Circinella minor]
MNQQHNDYHEQHHTNATENEEQNSGGYNTYPTYDSPQQSQNLQHQQPHKKRARLFYQQTSSYYDTNVLYRNHFNSAYEQQQQPILQSNTQATTWYVDSASSSRSAYQEPQQSQQQTQQQYQRSDCLYYYYNNYTSSNNNDLYSQVHSPSYNQQESMDHPTTANTVITTFSTTAVNPIPTTAPVTMTNKNNENKQEEHIKEYRSVPPALSEDTEVMKVLLNDDESDDESDYKSCSDNSDNDSEDSIEESKDGENSTNTFLSALHSTDEKVEWKKRHHFLNLISKYGEEPGVEYMEGELEHHDIKLPIQATKLFDKHDAIKWSIKEIKTFSKVDIIICYCQYDGLYIMKLTGTLGQCYFAIKAMDAIVRTPLEIKILYYVHFRITHVILRIDGPRFKEQAKNIKEVLSTIVPYEQYISRPEDLHVTIAGLQLTTEAQFKCLKKTIKEAAEELQEALKEDHFIGRFDTLCKVNTGFVSITSGRKEIDSFSIIRKVIQEKLKAAGLIHRARDIGERMHMTLYLSQKQISRRDSLLTEENLKTALIKKGINLDFGPAIATKLQITRRAVSLLAPFRQLYDFSYDL